MNERGAPMYTKLQEIEHNAEDSTSCRSQLFLHLFDTELAKSLPRIFQHAQQTELPRHICEIALNNSDFTTQSVFTDLHVFCMYFACILHVFCMYFACILHVFCMYFDPLNTNMRSEFAYHVTILRYGRLRFFHKLLLN